MKVDLNIDILLPPPMINYNGGSNFWGKSEKSGQCCQKYKNSNKISIELQRLAINCMKEKKRKTNKKQKKK